MNAYHENEIRYRELYKKFLEQKDCRDIEGMKETLAEMVKIDQEQKGWLRLQNAFSESLRYVM